MRYGYRTGTKGGFPTRETAKAWAKEFTTARKGPHGIVYPRLYRVWKSSYKVGTFEVGIYLPAD
mgnify:CR=1 FL=1